jgi:hypothetical protein
MKESTLMKVVRLIVKIVPIRLVTAGVRRMPGTVTPAERPKLFKFGGEIHSRPTGAIGSTEIRRRRP